MALPGVLAEIAEVAGEDAALALARALGGTQVYIPPVPANDHWLCRLIGRAEAHAVCERLTCGVGPRRVDLPIGPASPAAQLRAQVDAMLHEGRSERDIALATRYTTSAIRKRKAKLGIVRDDGQLTLF